MNAFKKIDKLISGISELERELAHYGTMNRGQQLVTRPLSVLRRKAILLRDRLQQFETADHDTLEAMMAVGLADLARSAK